MTIHFEGHRYGMTVNPPLRDEATGEIIEGSEQVVDSRFANWNHEDNEYDPELEKEAINEDEDHPDYVSEEVRMADTQQDILTAEEQLFDESLAASISSVDLGTTSETSVETKPLKWQSLAVSHPMHLCSPTGTLKNILNKYL